MPRQPKDFSQNVHDLKNYRKGCRCVECTTANRLYAREYWAQRKARERAEFDSFCEDKPVEQITEQKPNEILQPVSEAYIPNGLPRGV